MTNYYTSCNLFDMWGGECDPSMQSALDAARGVTSQPCHIPHHDIVVPPGPFEFVQDSKDKLFLSYMSPYTNDELKGLNRTHLLYYSGKIGAAGSLFQAQSSIVFTIHMPCRFAQARASSPDTAVV